MSDSSIDLSGQVALVTGGGAGLGRAFAQALADAGASVAVTARSEDQIAETAKLIKENGGKAIAVDGDVSKPHDVERIVEVTQRQLGPIDLLVNIASVITPLGSVWDADIDELWQLFNINVRGPYLCMRAVLPSMKARGKGRIINVSSSGAHTAHIYAPAYGASKAALSQFTNNVAQDLKEHGIITFAFGPKGKTPMSHLITTSPETPEGFRQRTINRDDTNPGNTLIDESVRMLMFLASGKADALAGRHVESTDSPNELMKRVDEIVQEDLYTLRRRT